MKVWTYIGSGQEATVYRGRMRNVEVARREDHTRGQGKVTFLKHLAAFILEQSFLKQGKYGHPHVAAPLGFYRDGYFYEYIAGADAFPWQLTDYDSPTGFFPVTLSEFREFCVVFSGFGFDVHHDVADANDGRDAKNIVMPPNTYTVDELYNTATLPPFWVRIDFGSQSCPFDKVKFASAIPQARNSLLDSVGEEGYKTLEYYARHLADSLTDNSEITAFRALIHQFRATTKPVFSAWLQFLEWGKKFQLNWDCAGCRSNDTEFDGAGKVG